MIKNSHSSRFVIGIDLGTTNCALAYVDTKSEHQIPQIFSIEQWEREGQSILSDTLPSFYYLPPKAEWKRNQLALPGIHTGAEDRCPDFAVGRIARSKAHLIPGRVIHAAKSWLCHSGIDRRERVLPWNSDEIIGDERRSPVEVLGAYLQHLRLNWNEKFRHLGEEALCEFQDVVITIPASFDEIAQRLTLEAALLAGFHGDRIKLLEEPQAAFYSWLGLNEHQLVEYIAKSQSHKDLKLLVCDIGGGTTDFSLFSAKLSDSGFLDLNRIAVSEHLLLGGENIDLSIAHTVEKILLRDGKELSPRQWASLIGEARLLKEQALSEQSLQGHEQGVSPSDFYLSIAGDGSRIVSGAVTVALSQNKIMDLIIEGFFPFVDEETRPNRQRTGLLQLGLPYANDTAITKHLSAFLSGSKVDAVLFAGGTIKPLFIRQRILSQLEHWQGFKPRVLEGHSYDLAVALGAAEFGLTLRKNLRRTYVKSGYPRSLYVEVGQSDSQPKLMCIVPKGFEQDQPLVISPHGLKVMANRPVRFRLFSSLDRPQDRPSDLVELDTSQFHRLPYLDTKIPVDRQNAQSLLIDVTLEISLLSTGVLDLAFIWSNSEGVPHRWRLEFVLDESGFSQSLSSPPLLENFSSEDKLRFVYQKILNFYGKKRLNSSDLGNPKHLVRDIESFLGVPRDSWNSTFLRSLWPYLEQGISRRGRSIGHELSWLYLSGYALRPGYGFQMDEWRIKELWQAYEQGLAFPKERQAEEQWWILWRRVAGGLTRAQQEQIFSKIAPQLRKGDVYSPEIYMLAASLERIDMGQKIRFGNDLVQQISSGRKQYLDQKIWALGRIASRIPLYAGPQSIVLPIFIENWSQNLKKLDISKAPYQRLSYFYSQAGRIVQDREFDISGELRQHFLDRLAITQASEEQIRPVRHYVSPTDTDKIQLFGESLPMGLWL